MAGSVQHSTLSGMRTEASPRKLKVLYIAGWGRSGSTLLGRILGQASDFFLVGELRYIWDRGLIEDRLCGCGATFSECPVWREVMFRTLEGGGRNEPEELVALRDHGLRTRHLLDPTNRIPRTRVARMGEYRKTLERLYHAVQSVSRSRVIVDTSKFPSHGYLLQHVPDIELYVLHLVRDPRAVAYSWASRRKLELDPARGPGTLMMPHSHVESSLVWNEWNLAIEKTWRREPERYMRVRYEDFVQSPRNTVETIFRFIDEESSDSLFVNEHEISLAASHTFSGNPNRLHGGTVKIESDEEWKREMSAVRQAAVTALTWPGLAHYGYPLWPQVDPVAKA